MSNNVHKLQNDHNQNAALALSEMNQHLQKARALVKSMAPFLEGPDEGTGHALTLYMMLEDEIDHIDKICRKVV